MKRRLVSLIEFVAYWSGIDSLFYWLNRGAKRVVAFHNVIPDEVLNETDVSDVCFRAGRFRLAVRELKKYFRMTSDFDDETGLTLTFDDGYLNQYAVAAEILREEGDIPAVIFVAGSLVNSVGFDRSLAIDKIQQWMMDVPLEVAERLFGRSFVNRAELWAEALLPEFAADVSGLGKNLLVKLEAVYPLAKIVEKKNPDFIRLRFDGITTEQLEDLRKRGWKIGYHTWSHFPTSRLDDDRVKFELTPPDSRMLLIPLAYPYGNADFVGVRDEKIVRDLGYPAAYSCEFDLSARHSAYFLPRMMPPIGKYRLHFEISGVRHFLKYRRLLPRWRS